MTEIITLDTFHSPYEVDRDEDSVSGGVMITLEKPFQEGMTRACVWFAPCADAGDTLH